MTKNGNGLVEFRIAGDKAAIARRAAKFDVALAKAGTEIGNLPSKPMSICKEASHENSIDR